jgi:uncharacterized RDD family membrane protein YckC
MTRASERMLIELLMAKPWKRLLAWLIDQVMLSALVSLPVYLMLGEPYPYVRTLEISMLASLVYFTSLEGMLGRTVGKLVLSITVYGENGRRVGFSKALLRRIGLVTPVLGFFDAAAILATPKRQRLFDVIAGTVVVENSRAPEAIAYLRGADVGKLLMKYGVRPRAPIEERPGLARTLRRMEEMRAGLRARYRRGELTREEYLQLKQKYEARMRELKEELGKAGL